MSTGNIHNKFKLRITDLRDTFSFLLLDRRSRCGRRVCSSFFKKETLESISLCKQNFLKAVFHRILLGPHLNTLSHIFCILWKKSFFKYCLFSLVSYFLKTVFDLDLYTICIHKGWHWKHLSPPSPLPPEYFFSYSRTL